MYTPLMILSYSLAFPVGELRYEISNDLSLDGDMWAVLNIKLTQLYRP